MPDQDIGSFAVKIDINHVGQRLDAFVAGLFPELSRNTLSRRIRLGEITVNGAPKKPGFRLSPGDTVSGRTPASEPSPALMPEPLHLSILFEDKSILVINKPPGLVVHPSPGHGHGTLAGGLLFHYPDMARVGGHPDRPGIVHRLDKDTSGLLVAAKTEIAYLCLVRQFKERLVSKKYLGLVYGEMKNDSGRILLPIGRHRGDRKKMGISDAYNARYAETHWYLRQRLNRASILELDIKTGRTHQIRVHCAAIRHPIVGDPTYGFKRPGRLFDDNPLLKRVVHDVPRQMLHAWQLEITHPETGEKMRFEAPLPEDMAAVIAAFSTLTNAPD